MKFFRSLLALGLALVGLASVHAQVPTWPKTSPADIVAAGLGVQLGGADFGNGIFVLSAYFGGTQSVPAITAAVFTSPDGTTWTRRTLPVNGRTGAPRYLNGKFLLGISPTGGGSVILSSTDAITWTASASLGASVQAPRTFAYGNGFYIGPVSAFPATSQIVTSPDGIAWTHRILDAGAQSSQIAFFKGKFYANSYNYSVQSGNQRLYSSTDGATWTHVTTAPTGPGITAASAAALLVSTYSSQTSGQAVSPDGSTFTTSSPGIKLVTETIRFLNGAFVATDSTTTGSFDLNVARASYDGHTWTAIGSTTNLHDAPEVAYGNGRYVFVGEFDVFAGASTITPGGTAPAVTTPTTTTSSPKSNPFSGNGSGGGGAPSTWFLALLALLGLGRRLSRA